jgi:hypothetical protein
MSRERTKSADAIKNRSAVRSEEYAKHFGWIDWLNARLGTSDAGLAEKAGLQKNYIYRKRADGTVLGAMQIRLLCDHYNVPGPDTYQLPGVAGLADEAAPFDPDKAEGVDPLILQAVRLSLKGRTTAQAWLLKTRALEDAGYQIGDVVIADKSAQPYAGDAVVAQVYDRRRDTNETVFRILEPPYLVAASSDPALRMPMLVDNRQTIVMATITQSFRGRRH